MNKISLSENHRRSLSSSLRVVEELLDEMEGKLKYPDDRILQTMERDTSEEDNILSLQNIVKAKQQIKKLAEKYGLSAHNSQLSRYINSHKSNIWVILSDSTSRKLKGFGEFPQEYSTEFDEDISQLQVFVNKI